MACFKRENFCGSKENLISGNDIGHEMAIEQAVRVNLQLTAEEHKRQLEIERAEQQAKRELAEAEAAAHAKEAATTAAALTTSDTPQG